MVVHLLAPVSKVETALVRVGVGVGVRVRVIDRVRARVGLRFRVVDGVRARGLGLGLDSVDLVHQVPLGVAVRLAAGDEVDATHAVSLELGVHHPPAASH